VAVGEGDWAGVGEEVGGSTIELDVGDGAALCGSTDGEAPGNTTEGNGLAVTPALGEAEAVALGGADAGAAVVEAVAAGVGVGAGGGVGVGLGVGDGVDGARIV
jgi:hypothetical protein